MGRAADGDCGKGFRVSLQQLQLGTAFVILLKTLPILMVRLGLYLVFWLFLLIYLGVVGGTAFLLGQLWPPLAAIVVLVAVVAIIPMYRLAYKYVFYLVKAAHLAVIVELLQRGTLPAGASQLGWGKDQVMDRFGAVSVLFLIDRLVAGVVRGITGLAMSFTSWIPGNSVRGITNMIKRVVEYAANYVDEAILARAFLYKDEDIWKTAQEGVVLYGMVWKPLLVNAVALMILSYVPFFLAILLLVAPMALFMSMISFAYGALGIVLVLILGVLIKIAVGDSYAMIAMVAAYQRETEGLIPDQRVEKRIARASEQFRKIQEKAMPAGSEGVSSPVPLPSAADASDSS